MTEEEFLNEYERRVNPHRYVSWLVEGKVKIYKTELQRRHSIPFIVDGLCSGRVKDVKTALKKANREKIPLEEVFGKMHDLAGVRIVVYYLSQVEDIHRCFQEDNDFDVSLLQDNIDQPREDGYRGLHLVVRMNVDIEGQPFTGRCEVQIRTLYQHMPAEKTHPLYKEGLLKDDLARRIKEHLDHLHKLDKDSEFMKDAQRVSGGDIT